ncbi:MAG: hypothetical protein HY043_23970 [Verrucomicrobia bacterium]|nr:hypothetical protein [Verrucomicrobiota bacterium]
MSTAKEMPQHEPFCPFCAQKIHDFAKIRQDFAQSLAYPQIIGFLLHHIKTPTHSAEYMIRHCLEIPAVRQSKEAVEALNRAARQVREAYQDFEIFLRPESSRIDKERLMTEADFRELHTTFEGLFRFQCDFRMTGLHDRSLAVGLHAYNQFLRMMLELSLLAVGRQARPHIEIEYRGQETFVACNLCLRSGSRLELDEMLFNLANIVARRIGISVVSEIHGEDRVFSWRIPLREKS